MEEAIERRALWVALSDLFLDTEVRWFLPRAARAGAPYPWDEVEDSFLREVAPVVGVNLLDIAGEWAGFDEDWLCQRIATRRSAHPVLEKARDLVLSWQLKELLTALRSLHAYLRGFSPADWEVETARLYSLAHLYIDREWSRMFSLWSHLTALSEWPVATLEKSFREGIEPVYSHLLKPHLVPSDATPQEARNNWEWFLLFLTWADGQKWPRGKLMTVCRELSFLYTIEDLARTPRGGQVRRALQECGIPAAVLEDWWRGPLSNLYQDLPRASWNWTQLIH